MGGFFIGLINTQGETDEIKSVSLRRSVTIFTFSDGRNANHKIFLCKIMETILEWTWNLSSIARCKMKLRI